MRKKSFMLSSILSGALFVTGIVSASHATATDFPTHHQYEPDLAPGYFLVPINGAPTRPDEPQSRFPGAICQVDGSRLSGYTFQIYNALCMAADVQAVQRSFQAPSGPFGNWHGNWIHSPGQVSSATRPRGTAFVDGWALARAR